MYVNPYKKGVETMRNMTNINVRVDAELKDQFSKVLDDIGLTVTSALNVFIKAVVREGGIPFQIKTEAPLTDNELEALALLNSPEGEGYASVAELRKAKGW